MGPQTVAPAQTLRPTRVEPTLEERDWGEWFEELSPGERRSLRNRALTAPYDEVRDDAELRHYFLFTAEDLATARAPGTDRIRELHTIIETLKGRSDPDVVQQRRKAAAFLLAEFQAFLRDNPWVS